MHVGAPENRIIKLFKERVLTPRGRNMIPEFGLGGHRLTFSRLAYQEGIFTVFVARKSSIPE